MNRLIHDMLLAFWRLLPANPIVLRVVHMGSKRVQHLWARCTYLLILLFVMLAAYANQDAGGSLGEVAKSATRQFEYISVLQLAMICLLAPVFTAGAISQEKDAETYNVLLTTPLTSAQIALGSLLSRLFFIIVLLVSGLPIFCITMLYGGVTAEQIFYSFGIAACSALATGALAILVSVLRIGTRGTVFSFHAAVGLYLFGGLGLGWLRATYVPESVVPGTGEGMTWLAPFHPYWALRVALKQTRAPEFATVAHYPWPVDVMLASPHAAYMIISVMVSVILVAVATLFVRRGVRQGEPGWWTRFMPWRWAGYGGERTRRARRVWSNPVAWREAMTRANATSSTVAVYGYLAVGAALGLGLLYAYCSGRLGGPASARLWLTGLIMFEFVTVLLMATNSAATAITREREAGTIELLLSTPLTKEYIIFGKLRGLVSFTVPLMAVPAVTALVAAVVDLFRPVTVPIVSLSSALLLAVLLMVYSAFACMLGLHMSLKNKRSIQAVLASVGVLIVVGFGLSMCAFALVSSHMGKLAAIIAPLTFVTSIYGVLNPQELVGGPGGGAAAGLRLEAAIYLVVGTLIAAGLYGAITAGMYKRMKNEFDMTLRKQSN